MDTRLRQALAHHQAGDFAQAEPLYRRCLEEHPDDPDIQNFLGALLGQRGELEEGEALLRSALRATPRHAPVWTNLGGVLRAAGRSEEAEAAYAEALRLEPADPENHANLGMALVDRGDPAAASDHFREAVRLRRAPGGLGGLLEGPPRTTRSRLKHDAEQAEHLAVTGLLPKGFRHLPEAYRRCLEAAPDTDEVFRMDAAVYREVAGAYDRLVHQDPGERLSGPAVNPELDRAAIEEAYFSNGPGIAHFDELLTERGLSALRRFCLDSTIWFKDYPRGYQGAMMKDGFSCPLLMQIGEELREALPGIFGEHGLREWWAFKYDSRLDGIPIHADHAAVNVNFWITPDEALAEPEAGGLTVWDVEAPLDWDFRRYNTDETAMREFIAETGAQPVYVPYRQNRVVMFNSDLFHATGRIAFREGYGNRRINVTFLYGDRRET